VFMKPQYHNLGPRMVLLGMYSVMVDCATG
jgi:hypothetical protein